MRGLDLLPRFAAWARWGWGVEGGQEQTADRLGLGVDAVGVPVGGDLLP